MILVVTILLLVKLPVSMTDILEGAIEVPDIDLPTFEHLLQLSCPISLIIENRLNLKERTLRALPSKSLPVVNLACTSSQDYAVGQTPGLGGDAKVVFRKKIVTHRHMHRCTMRWTDR